MKPFWTRFRFVFPRWLPSRGPPALFSGREGRSVRSPALRSPSPAPPVALVASSPRRAHISKCAPPPPSCAAATSAGPRRTPSLRAEKRGSEGVVGHRRRSVAVRRQPRLVALDARVAKLRRPLHRREAEVQRPSLVRTVHAVRLSASFAAPERAALGLRQRLCACVEQEQLRRAGLGVRVALQERPRLERRAGRARSPAAAGGRLRQGGELQLRNRSCCARE